LFVLKLCIVNVLIATDALFSYLALL